MNKTFFEAYWAIYFQLASKNLTLEEFNVRMAEAREKLFASFR